MTITKFSTIQFFFVNPGLKKLGLETPYPKLLSRAIGVVDLYRALKLNSSRICWYNLSLLLVVGYTNLYTLLLPTGSYYSTFILFM